MESSLTPHGSKASSKKVDESLEGFDEAGFQNVAVKPAVFVRRRSSSCAAALVEVSDASEKSDKQESLRPIQLIFGSSIRRRCNRPRLQIDTEDVGIATAPKVEERQSKGDDALSSVSKKEPEPLVTILRWVLSGEAFDFPNRC